MPKNPIVIASCSVLVSIVLTALLYSAMARIDLTPAKPIIATGIDSK